MCSIQYSDTVDCLVYSIVFTVQCVVYSTVYTVHCVVYSTVLTVHSAVYGAVFTVDCEVLYSTVFTLYCELYRTVFTEHCSYCTHYNDNFIRYCVHIKHTLRYGPLRGPTPRSCGELRPLPWGKKRELIMLFWLIFGNFGAQ